MIAVMKEVGWKHDTRRVCKKTCEIDATSLSQNLWIENEWMEVGEKQEDEDEQELQ